MKSVKYMAPAKNLKKGNPTVYGCYEVAEGGAGFISHETVVFTGQVKDYVDGGMVFDPKSIVIIGGYPAGTLERDMF